MTDYELKDLYDAAKEARNTQTQEIPWTLFQEAYGDDAKYDFLNAVDNGDVEVNDARAGIRADGSWPRYNTGRLVFRVMY